MATKRHRLAQRRKTVGFTQEGLAEQLGVDSTTVRRWESGETETGPQPWLRPKLARCLHVSIEQLEELLWFDVLGEKRQRAATESAAMNLPALVSNGVPESPTDPDTSGEHTDDPNHDPVLAAPWNHRGTVEVAVLLSGGGDLVKRRGFLFLTGAILTAPAHQWLVHEPEPLVSGLSGRRVSAGLVNRLPAMVGELRRMDDVAGGGNVLSLAQHEFGWVARLLDQASYDERTGRILHIALAELGQLCGWAAYDAGQQGLAQRYYITALRAAHTADDRPLGAYILGCMAEQAARQGRPTESVTLIETALAGTRSWQTPRLLAQLYNWQAWVFATLQDPSACTAAISRARTQAEQFQPDNDPAWLYWVNSADIAAGSGQCLLQLGQPDRAATMLDEGIALFDESLVRDRQIHLTYLTDALTRPGKQRDLDAAVGYGMTAIQLAEGLDSTLSVARIRDLYHQLQPDAQVPAVRDFLERARGLWRDRND